MSQPALVIARIQRLKSPLRNGSCPRPPGNRLCRPRDAVVTLRWNVEPGSHRRTWNRLLGGRALEPGSYRVTVRARNRSGDISGLRWACFEVEPPRL